MTTKKEILQAIREHCLDCCDGSWRDVRDCTSILTPEGTRRCKLYPYRFGTDPKPTRNNKNLKKH